MGLLSVIAGVFVTIACGMLLAGIGVVIAGFCTAMVRDMKERRKPALIEKGVIDFLAILRGRKNEDLRVVKEKMIGTYPSGNLYCQAMCEAIDRLIAGKQMEDRDVRTIIKTFEAWNEQSRKAVPIEN